MPRLTIPPIPDHWQEATPCRVWRKTLDDNRYKLELYYGHYSDGRDSVHVRFFKDGEMLFQKEDWVKVPATYNPKFSYDSLATVYTALDAVTMMDGNGDEDWFTDNHYTTRQLAWAESSDCDSLGSWAREAEDKYLRRAMKS